MEEQITRLGSTPFSCMSARSCDGVKGWRMILYVRISVLYTLASSGKPEELYTWNIGVPKRLITLFLNHG